MWIGVTVWEPTGRVLISFSAWPASALMSVTGRVRDKNSTHGRATRPDPRMRTVWSDAVARDRRAMDAALRHRGRLLAIMTAGFF